MCIAFCKGLILHPCFVISTHRQMVISIILKFAELHSPQEENYKAISVCSNSRRIGCLPAMLCKVLFLRRTMLKAIIQSPNYSILSPWWHYPTMSYQCWWWWESFAHLISFNKITDLRLGLFPLLPLLAIVFLLHS